jgi:hypothetical protein
MTRLEAKSMLARVRDIVLRDADKGEPKPDEVKTEADQVVAFATFIRDFAKTA